MLLELVARWVHIDHVFISNATSAIGVIGVIDALLYVIKRSVIPPLGSGAAAVFLCCPPWCR